jgi:hypothetical protein
VSFGLLSRNRQPGTELRVERFLRKLAGVADLEDALKKLDRLTQEEARIAFAEVLRATHSSRDDVKVVDSRVESVEDMYQKVEVVQNDDIKVDSDTVDNTVRRRSVDSEEQGPSSLASLPIPPQMAVGRRRSFGVRELSAASVPYRQVTLSCLRRMPTLLTFISSVVSSSCPSLTTTDLPNRSFLRHESLYISSA